MPDIALEKQKMLRSLRYSPALNIALFFALLCGGLSFIVFLGRQMDRAVQAYHVDIEHLGADYSTIFKTPLTNVHLLDAMRIPNARFNYALESKAPLELQDPEQFQLIELHRGNHWPFTSYPWITRCFYRQSPAPDTMGPGGDVHIYCDDSMKQVCVQGYYHMSP